MALKAAIKEEKPETEDQPIHTPPVDVVLNCKRFKTLRLEDKGERVFRAKFTTDNLSSGTVDLDLSSNEDRTQLEHALAAISDLVVPKVHPDQNKDNISLVGIVRKDKQNRSKEPKTFFVFITKNSKGFGYTSKSKDIQREDLGEAFDVRYTSLDACIQDEIQRYQDPQLSLLNDTESDDDGGV